MQASSDLNIRAQRILGIIGIINLNQYQPFKNTDCMGPIPDPLNSVRVRLEHVNAAKEVFVWGGVFLFVFAF